MKIRTHQKLWDAARRIFGADVLNLGQEFSDPVNLAEAGGNIYVFHSSFPSIRNMVSGPQSYQWYA